MASRLCSLTLRGRAEREARLCLTRPSPSAIESSYLVRMPQGQLKSSVRSRCVCPVKLGSKLVRHRQGGVLVAARYFLERLRLQERRYLLRIFVRSIYP